VDHVHAVVSQLAVAPVPEPMPFVMEVVIVKRPARRRTLPEIIVEPVGNRRWLAPANGWAVVRVPSLRIISAANDTAANLLDGFGDFGPTPPLRSQLDQTVVLAGRLDHQLALAWV